MGSGDLVGERPRSTDLLHFKVFIFLSYKNLEVGLFESERLWESREFSSAWGRFPWGLFGKCKTKLFWIWRDPVTYKMWGISRTIWVPVQTRPNLADGFPSNSCSSCFSEEMFLMGLMNFQSLLKSWWLYLQRTLGLIPDHGQRVSSCWVPEAAMEPRLLLGSRGEILGELEAARDLNYSEVGPAWPILHSTLKRQ